MNNFSFIKNRKVFFSIVAVILVIGIASFVIRGFNVDIDFIGGTTIQLEMNKELSVDDLDGIKNSIAAMEVGDTPDKLYYSEPVEDEDTSEEVETVEDTVADTSAETETVEDTAVDTTVEAETAEDTAVDTTVEAETAEDTAVDTTVEAETAEDTAVDTTVEAENAEDTAVDTTVEAETAEETATDDAATENTAVESNLPSILVKPQVSTIQRAGEGTQVIIKLIELDSETRDAVCNLLAAEYGLDLTTDLLGVNNVGASVSADLRNAAIIATLIAILLMLVYISIRFEILSGLAAVVCLTHDIFVMFAVYSLLQIPLNSTMIAAILTILGYSINATIIVFDRIRENVKLHSKDKFEDNVDKSIKQTLTRSLNTTLTTLFTIGLVYILGVDSIKQFALPIIVGVLAGLFSSVCLAGNIWAILKKAFNKNRV